MANQTIPFSIRFSAVEDFFNCPVCLQQLKDTHTTPCGHRYCEGCIKEWNDRHWNCPCCNRIIQNEAQLVKDHQFDDLIRAVNKEKDVSEKQYFADLIDEASTSTAETHSSSVTSKQLLSPIETVLKHHLKESLIAHQKYYQELASQVEQKKKDLEEEFQRSCSTLQSVEELPFDEAHRQKEELQAEKEQKVCEMERELARTTACVTEAYDKYLRDHIPSLTILPVRIDIVLLSKSITLQDVELKAQDSIADIKLKICTEMQKRGDKIVGFGDDAQCFAFGPFTKRTASEMFDMVRNIVEYGARHMDIQSIAANARPVMQYGLKPGSVIAVYGHVMYESDLPKQCFSLTFQKGQGKIMDYFRCIQCNFNWICRPCMEACHKDHEIVPYIMGHQPTWACCYCPKKKVCHLVSS